MVATTVQQNTANKAKEASSVKQQGQRAVPPKPNKGKVSPANRMKGETLAGAVGESLTNTAGAVANVSGELLKHSAKGGLRSGISILMHPIRIKMQLAPPFMTKPLVNFFSSKLDNYMQAGDLDIGIKPSKIVNDLLFGDIDNLSDEVIDLLDGFIKKSFSAELTEALQTGNILKITKAAGLSVSRGTQGLFGQLFNQPGSNKFTSPFKFIGAKTPLIKKLPGKFQPWAAGAGVFMFGGLAVQMVLKFTKLLFKGGLLVGLAAGGKKVFDMVTKSKAGGMIPGAKAPSGMMGGAMNALGAMAGGGAKPGAAGAGNLLNTASSLMGMFGGGRK